MKYEMNDGIAKVWVTGRKAFALIDELNNNFPSHGLCSSGADYVSSLPGRPGYVEVEFIEDSDKAIFLNIIKKY